jgi:hypothetical protein
MGILFGLLLLTGAYPFWRALHANRQTSLQHAIYWAILAWAAWTGTAMIADSIAAEKVTAARYVALCLTGCAGVAVLGARRPGVAAWDFAVVALLAVNLLPLGEGLALGKSLNLDGMRITCVVATLAVGVLNYLPTRLGAAAVMLGTGSALQMTVPAGPLDSHGYLQMSWLALAAVPWLAFGFVTSTPAAPTEADALWFDYRNRFGFLWGLRLREQFNRSAAHAEWPVVLGWRGLHLLPGAVPLDSGAHTEMAATLRALLKRFGPDEPRAKLGRAQ